MRGKMGGGRVIRERVYAGKDGSNYAPLPGPRRAKTAASLLLPTASFKSL